MPAKNKVNIMWQIVFVLFIPIADIWAFYRIKKLQKSIIYLVLPSIGLLGLNHGSSNVHGSRGRR